MFEERNQREITLTFRASKAEKEALKERAKKEKKSVSKIIRLCILDYLDKSETE